MSGAQALLEILRDEGVQYLFGNPGSTELVLMDALAVEPHPRFVLGLHEGVVMSMAHGYAASTGKLAAVNLHAAPGLGNALGMLYNARKAGAPVLVTAGQQDRSISLREPLLWDELATIAKPFVKWSLDVQRLADLPRALRRAAKVALTPPMGPVFLSLPGDLLAETAELDLMSKTRVGTAVRGDAATLARAAEMISVARRPVIFAGDSVCQHHAHAALVRFAEAIGAPVYLEGMADRASFPTSHRLFAGTVARLAPAVRALLAKHDLIVSVGGDLFTESLATGMEPIPADMPIVHLDNDVWELGKNYPVQAAMLGDPAATLPELTAAVLARWSTQQSADVEARRASVVTANDARRSQLAARVVAMQETAPIQPLALLAAIGRLLPADAVVIDESLSAGASLQDLIAMNDECAYFGLRGGGIGTGLPHALGAKLGHPQRPVIALIGDGSSLFSFQALWTAAHYKIVVIFVILNNRSYRILKQRTVALGQHAARTGTLIGMDLIDPEIDFIGLSQAVGVAATRVTTLDEFETALPAAMAAGQPRLIEVVIDGRLQA